MPYEGKSGPNVESNPDIVTLRPALLGIHNPMESDTMCNIIILGRVRRGEQPHRRHEPDMVRIGRELAYHYGACGLCDDQLRQLGERWCNGLHSQIEC
jgi:hypothetical protein